MKQFGFVVTICLLLVLFPACSPNQQAGIDSESTHKIELRSNCQTTQVDRLAVNDDYSINVVQCYDNGVLVDLDYIIVARNSIDKVAVLDLTSGASGSQSITAHVFEEQIDNLSYTSDVYTSYAIAADENDYICECNDKDSDTFDCILRSYSNLWYCDGNFCLGCSIVVILEPGEPGEVQVKTSVVLLPNTF